MNMLVQYYKLNEKTMALAPAKQIEYDTIVYETNRTIYVKQTPLQLIKAACLNNWSTYEGRREAVMHHLGYRRNVPIPIDTDVGIIAFPTHSPRNIDCHWIIYSHVLTIESNNIGASIIFNNHHVLPLNISPYILNKQLERSFTCLLFIKQSKNSTKGVL